MIPESTIRECFRTDSGNKDSRAASEPTRQRRQIHEIERKPGILSGCLTPARPAAVPQVIENKNTTGINEIRETQNQRKCPHNMAYHDIS
jgi:hypothetical protein